MIYNVISDIYKVIVSVCFQVLPTQKWDFSHTLMMSFDNANLCMFLFRHTNLRGARDKSYLAQN
jgi:hypothetical protein